MSREDGEVRQNRRGRGGGGKKKSGSFWAGSVPDHQHPPQLFPQLPPSDAQFPLSAATPQRENWSRHRSAKNTHTPNNQLKRASVHEHRERERECAEPTSEQLLVRAHGPHANLFVDDIHASQTEWKHM